jgi:hypothetical protein
MQICVGLVVWFKCRKTLRVPYVGVLASYKVVTNLTVTEQTTHAHLSLP